MFVARRASDRPKYDEFPHPDTAEYFNHLMGCRECYAPTNRYCAFGNALRMESDSQFISVQRTREERRYWLEAMGKTYPGEYKEFEKLAMEKYEASKKVLSVNEK